MKQYSILFLLVALMLSACSDNDDDTKDNGDVYQSTLTVTINGDGFNNSTYTYTGVEGNTTYLWAVRYYETDPFGGEGDYSIAQLYRDPETGASQLDAIENGLVNICFSGNEPMTENISGDGVTAIAGGEGRGVDIQIKLEGDEFARAYYIEDGTTTGTITVSEYGNRVKGSFSIQNLQKHMEAGTTVDITGTFDLAFFDSY